MKKLTLEKTWTECLRMWKGLVKKVRAAAKAGKPLPSVIDLKAEWSKRHGYAHDDIDANCFFCEYDAHRNDDCKMCPGKKVDPQFHCRNKDYNFYTKPIAFYNKLATLYKIYRKRKKK